MTRYFSYYRAGILLARLSIDGQKIFCAPRDLESLCFSGEVPYVWPMAPLDPELDSRFPDALACVGSGAVPEGYQLAAAEHRYHQGRSHMIHRLVQPAGKCPLDIILGDGQVVACIDNERNYLGLLVEDGWEFATPLAQMLEDPLLSRPAYGLDFAGMEMVAMRDGVKLATDVYLPARRADGQTFPTVLIRTCYNKQNVKQFLSFVHYGYAVVAQDTRGRELSEGDWQPIINERDDGRRHAQLDRPAALERRAGGHDRRVLSGHRAVAGRGQRQPPPQGADQHGDRRRAAVRFPPTAAAFSPPGPLPGLCPCAPGTSTPRIWTARTGTVC